MIHWGWRMVFYAFSVPGAILAIIWYILVRNRPEESSHCNALEQEHIRQATSPEAGSRHDLEAKPMGWVDACIRARRGMKVLDTKKGVLTSWHIWADCIVVFLFSGMVGYGLMTWIPSYLVNERHLSLIRMGVLAAVPFFGFLVGTIGGGWASDRLWRGRRKPLMFIATIAEVALMYLLANAPASQVILGVLLFLAGVGLTCCLSCFVSYPMGLATPKAFPTALGMVWTASSLGGFFSPMIAGYILDVFKTFNNVFYFFAGSAAVAFLILLTMVEPLQTISAEKE
jgi:sugar phosphate permease